MNDKPIRWDDAVARHDPASLPFLRFFQEAQEARRAEGVLRRARRFFRPRDEPRNLSIPPQ